MQNHTTMFCTNGLSQLLHQGFPSPLAAEFASTSLLATGLVIVLLHCLLRLASTSMADSSSLVAGGGVHN